MRQFIETETKELDEQKDQWARKKENADLYAELEEKKLKQAIEDDKIKLQQLKKEHENLVNSQQEQENAIKQIIQDRIEQRKKEAQTDNVMMLIQKEFEEWLKIKGPTKKKRAAKKK